MIKNDKEGKREKATHRQTDRETDRSWLALKRAVWVVGYIIVNHKI